MVTRSSGAAPDASDGSPAFYSRRRRRGNELGQLLLRRGVISPEQLRIALRAQAETGGHIGAILKRMGACDGRAIAEALLEQVRIPRSRAKGHTIVRRARENPSISWLDVRCRPELVALTMVFTDVVTLSASAALMWACFPAGQVSFGQLYGVGAIVVLCLATLTAIGLHSVTPPSPPDEIRSTSVTLTMVYFGCWTVAGIGHLSALPPPLHWAWLLGWAASVVLVPVVRGGLRAKLSKQAWWGHPVVVFGAGKVGRSVVSLLQSRPQLGLKPVGLLDDNPARHGTVRASWGQDDIVLEPVRDFADDDFESPSVRVALEQFSEVEGVPVIGGLELAPALAQRLGIRTAVLAMPEMDASSMLALIERFADSYTNVLVIPDLFNLTYFGAPTRYLGGALGIEVRRQLLLRGPRAAKRAMDISLTLVGITLLLPLFALVALIIKLDSHGPIFHRQKRLGQDGVRFRALKFRTMFVDAEARLKDLLESDPALRAEYENFHKLSGDPRVTRAGRFLRKYSLDELPQLWNVLVGEMSLVGPRPYLEREIPDMAQKEAIILRVKPGITGIWQVTWRNESTFEQRLGLDVEYVRSWSPWMDIYILARTVPVVVGGTGS